MKNHMELSTCSNEEKHTDMYDNDDFNNRHLCLCRRI